jgi:hypothetical protein
MATSVVVPPRVLTTEDVQKVCDWVLQSVQLGFVTQGSVVGVVKVGFPWIDKNDLPQVAVLIAASQLCNAHWKHVSISILGPHPEILLSDSD